MGDTCHREGSQTKKPVVTSADYHDNAGQGEHKAERRGPHFCLGENERALQMPTGFKGRTQVYQVEKDGKGLTEGNDRCKATERGMRHKEARGRGRRGRKWALGASPARLFPVGGCYGLCLMCELP